MAPTQRARRDILDRTHAQQDSLRRAWLTQGGAGADVPWTTITLPGGSADWAGTVDYYQGSGLALLNGTATPGASAPALITTLPIAPPSDRTFLVVDYHAAGDVRQAAVTVATDGTVTLTSTDPVSSLDLSTVWWIT